MENAQEFGDIIEKLSNLAEDVESCSDGASRGSSSYGDE